MLTTAAPAVVRCRPGHVQLPLLAGPTRLQFTVPSWRPLINPGSTGTRRSYGDSHSHQDAPVRQIRNIGIIAHVDAGKTTTTERMLYFAGLKGKPGDVDTGNTVTDFLPLEREKGITIQSAAITMLWPPAKRLAPGQQPTVINLIDTPGHLDFGFEVIRSMPELDGAVTILDASKGVETNTENVWRLARQHRVPTICYVNKHDLPGASFRRSVLDMASTLGTRPLVCQIPWWNRDQLVGHVDVIDGVGMKYASMGAMSIIRKDVLPAELRAEVQRARSHLVETLSEHDEDMMAAFMEHEDAVPSDRVKQSIRGLISDGRNRLTPVFVGASKINVGVQPLLDAIVDYLPSPDERPELEVSQGSRTLTLAQVLEEESKKKGHDARRPPVGAVAHVFKVVDDPQRGLVSYVRVHHGTLSKGDLWNSRELRFERPLNILHIFADKTQDISHLAAGHIGALTGLKSARTGDTLIHFAGGKHAPEALRGLQIRRPEPPPAVAFVSMEPWQTTAAQRLEAALARLVRVDPSFRYHFDDKTETYIFSGRGRLHLEIALERLANFYKISRDDVKFGKIEVEYQECLLGAVGPLREEYDRPIDSQAGRAACTVTLEPLEPLEPLGAVAGDNDSDGAPLHKHKWLLESSIERDGNLVDIAIRLPQPAGGGDDLTAATKNLPIDPDAVHQQVLNGVRALARGPRRGAPVTGCRVRIVFDYATDLGPGGTTTPGHVQRAATHAMQTALRRAHAAGLVGLREPFVRARITCPEAMASAVQHDLVARRGGQVFEVRSLDGGEADEDGAVGEDLAAGGAEDGARIDLATVYAPPDPYETAPSLRAARQKDEQAQQARTVQITAKAPLREMLEYDARLRDLTSGRQDMQMEPAGFEAVTGARLRALES